MSQRSFASVRNGLRIVAVGVALAVALARMASARRGWWAFRVSASVTRHTEHQRVTSVAGSTRAPLQRHHQALIASTREEAGYALDDDDTHDSLSNETLGFAVGRF